MSATTNTGSLPLTYPDAQCFDDVDGFGNETASDLETLEQDIYHILIQAPGSNPDDTTLGIGVENYLSGTEGDLAAMPSLIDEQLERDSRIDASHTTLTQDSDGDYSINIEIVVDGETLGLSFGYSSANGLTPGTS